MPLIRVALDVPLAQLFDYHCTDSNARIGARVLVPFGRQQLVGVIVAMPTHSDFPAAKI
jgi:primosomal protein N' (replication factor Y)